MPHHLAKLALGPRKFFLIDSVLTAVLQPREPYLRRRQLIERFRDIQPLLLLLAETSFELADVIKRVLVFAAWLTARCRHQFAPPLLDGLRQFPATPPAEDRADLGLQPLTEACQCRFGQVRSTE